jgi:hypothetical protein
MPSTTRVILAALALVLLIPATADAKAWTQPEGDTYAKVWLRGIFGSDAFLADGTIADSESYQDVSLRHYVEYGLTDDWTLLTYGAPAGLASYGNNSSAYVGPLALGVRRGFIDGPVQLAAEAHYGYAPRAGDKDLAPQGALESYRPAVETHFGVGELQVGYGLGWGWMVASAGFQWNSAEEVDSAVIGFSQLGVKLTETWIVEAHSSIYEPLGDVEETNVSGVGQTRYLGFGVGVSWWVTEAFGLNAGIDGAVYAESNAAAPSFSLGMEGKF